MDDRLRSWVEAEAGGQVTEARRGFVGGSRELWFVDLVRDGQSSEVVVRHERGHGALSGSSFSLRREADVYAALAESPVPVPRLIAFGLGGDAMVLERLAGDSRVNAHDAASVRDSFVEAVAALHTLDTATRAATGFPHPPNARDHALADLSRWATLADARLTTPEPLIGYARGWLVANAPASVQATVLVQGDTGPGNFLHESGSVTGLVDFEFAHLGDPMDDIAWIDMRSATAPPAFDNVGARDARYETLTGFEVEPAAVRYYAVMVRLRCAITTGVTISGGGGALGLVPYVGPHHRFLCELAAGLADAMGADHTQAEIPDADPSVRAALYDHVINGLRADVMSELSSPQGKLRVRSAVLLAEHDRQRDALGEQLEADERADRVKTLGHPASDDELAELAVERGAAGDSEMLGLLARGAHRSAMLWPSAGSVSPGQSIDPRRR